jgi:hypothetical protein
LFSFRKSYDFLPEGRNVGLRHPEKYPVGNILIKEKENTRRIIN